MHLPADPEGELMHRAFYALSRRWRSWAHVPPSVAEVEAEVSDRCRAVLTAQISDVQRQHLLIAELALGVFMLQTARPNAAPVVLDLGSRAEYRRAA